MGIRPKQQLLPSFLLILFNVVCLLLFTSFATTAATTSATPGIIIKLIHADAGKNLTYPKRINAAIHRTHHRAQHLLHPNTKVNESPPPTDRPTPLYLPIRSHGAECIMSLAVGTPPTSFLATVDTGSSLVWAKCSHQGKPDDSVGQKVSDSIGKAVFNPQSSSSYSKVSCPSPMCNGSDANFSCHDGECDYTVDYWDRSTSFGTLSSDVFTLGSLTVENISFGCSVMLGGFETHALVGFNRGRLSLISQLGPTIDHQFSFCLGGFEATDQSKLVLGPSSKSMSSGATINAPLLINPLNPDQYFVTFDGISVAGNRLPIPESAFQFNSNGTGGVVIDSGSTLTSFVPEAYSYVREAFVKQLGDHLTKPPHFKATLELDLCFGSLPNSVSIPTMALHFDKGSDMQLPIDNYITTNPELKISCVAIIPSTRPVNIIGANIMGNFLANFDLGRNMVSFTPTQCSEL